MFLPASVLLLALAAGTPATQPTELVWTDLRGHDRTLEAYRGRIVVLNFWATWCAPCRKEMPDLVRIQKRYGMYGIQVVGASADETAASASVEQFARRLKINFPVLLGATTEQMQSLDVGVALPATVVLDRDGKVVERIEGVFDPAKLEAVLDRLLDPSDTVATADHHDHGEDEDDHDHEPPPSDATEASLVPS